MTVQFSGHDSGVLLLHLECSDCGELSLGFPNDEAQQLTDHPTRKHALEDGWEERFDGAVVMHRCPECRKKKGRNTMGEQKQAKPKQLEIKVPIDGAVIELKRAKLVDTEQDIDKLQAKKREVSADYTEKIKELKERRKELLEQIDSGMQRVTAPVTERRDERRAMVLTVRTDTGDVVDERAMTFDERQVTVEEHIEKQNGAANGAAPKKKGGGKGRKRAEARA